MFACGRRFGHPQCKDYKGALIKTLFIIPQWDAELYIIEVPYLQGRIHPQQCTQQQWETAV